MKSVSPKFITIINDCKSQNDIGRQETRYGVLFPETHISFVGIDSSLGITSTLEASGNLLDILDASEGLEGIVAVNVAPRGQVKEDGENGSRFCYFWYRKTLVVSTIKGYNLSLVKRLGIAEKINILETKEVLGFALAKKIINKELFSYVSNSQFRSFDFMPRVASWLFDSQDLPHHITSIEVIPDASNSVWLIDSFGNAKTTLIKNDLSTINGQIKTNIGAFNYYERLRLVPDGKTAIYTGSSGIGDKRFLEIATQNRNGSAAKSLNLKVGDNIEIL